MTDTVYAGARFSVDEKNEAEAILKDMGLTLSAYFKMMVAQLRINRAIPSLSQYPTTLSQRSAQIVDAYDRGEYAESGKTFASAEDAISALGI